MKKQFKHLVLYFPLLITLSAFSGNTQNQFTHIASKNNRSCNGNCTMLDIPQLNNNPKAILFVTLKDKSVNPHPFGAYYFKGKWNIMNLDQAAIPDGAKFTVEYFINPDQDHFQYLIKKENLQQKDGSAFIDHPALNNHPDAQFSVFHSWVPEAKEYGNREEVQVQYDPGAGKWVLSIVSNLVNKSLPVNSAYNINITSAGNATTKPVNTTPVNTTPVNTTPAITNPNPTSNANSVSGPIIGIYMTVWVSGTKLPGDNIKAKHVDQTELLGYELGVVTARDAATGQASGRRSHEPVIIKCPMGYPGTPPILNALIKSQSLTVLLDFYTIDQATGTEVINYSVKLSNVLVAGFREIYAEDAALNTMPGGIKRSYNEIKFTFKKIEFISATGGIVEDNN